MTGAIVIGTLQMVGCKVDVFYLGKSPNFSNANEGHELFSASKSANSGVC
jgi:hypothetical protein